MANNYTTIPAIIPGNLTVAGNLTVQGTELRLGAAMPFVRLTNQPPDIGRFTVNLQNDGITRDDVSRIGMALNCNVTSRNYGTITVDQAGDSILADLARVFWYDHGIHNVLGVSGLQTVATKTVYANQIGTSGAMFLRFAGQATTSASGTMAVGISFGGQLTNLFTVPSSQTTNWFSNVIIGNNNNASSQGIQLFCGWGAGGVITGTFQTTINTTANQILAITATPSDTASTLAVWAIEAEFVPRFSPI